MNRSRVRIAAVVVPALIIGALLGNEVGSRLFAAPESTADGRAAAQKPIEVTVTIPSGTAQPTDVAVLAAPAPSDPATSTTQGPPGGPGNPGNPAGGNPPPQPQPTGATTTTGPPPPAWGSQLNTSIQVVGTYPAGGTVQLGRAEGWFQMHNDRTKFRYSFTFCRQSSYMLPTMAISVNGQPLATINPPYSGNSTAQPCYGSTATVSNEHGHPSIQNVYFKLSGSTFIGNEHVVFTQDRTFYNSN